MSLKKSLKWILLAAPILNILIVLSGEESVSKWLPSELTFIVSKGGADGYFISCHVPSFLLLFLF